MKTRFTLDPLKVALFILENWNILFLLFVTVAITVESCTPKPKKEPTQSVPVPSTLDSVRHQLELSVDGSNNTVIISQGVSQSAVLDYEKAKQKFDQTGLTLP